MERVLPWLDVVLGTLPLPIWAVAAAVALLVVLGVLAFPPPGARPVSVLARAIFVLITIIAVWIYFDRAAVHERTANRRALDQRAVSLTAQAAAPHSALACLDAMAGDTVEAACEKAVFASPQAVAAAVSYVAARLALLADGAAYAESADATYDAVLAPVRLALETDRFGIVAHVFAMRDSCTALQCDALNLLRDPSRVQANLKERTFDGYITRYAADWAARGGTTPVAEGATTSTLASTGSMPAPAAAAAGPPAAGTPMSSRYDFPSAASIPPVSIMTPEPGSPAAGAPQAATRTAAPIPPRRPARTAAPRAIEPPVQLAPSASGAPEPSR